MHYVEKINQAFTFLVHIFLFCCCLFVFSDLNGLFLSIFIYIKNAIEFFFLIFQLIKKIDVLVSTHLKDGLKLLTQQPQ